MVNIFTDHGGFDNNIYQHQEERQDKTLYVRQKPLPREKHWKLTNQEGNAPQMRRHKNVHHPSFAGLIENVTVNVGREATLECLVNHLGKYKVRFYLKCIRGHHRLGIITTGILTA